MHLQESPELAAFRGEVRRFCAAHLDETLSRAGRLMTSVFADFDAAMAWQQILHRQGWLVPDWPVAWGGTGWDLAQRNVFREECALAGAPALVPMGLQMLGPMLIHFGSEAQKRELLPRILSGEDRWCQGYSEPNAGSDLASLSMRARRDGEHYLLDGSKIWTSYAHRSNRIFCLVRTSTDGPPQRGISFVLVDLAAPGIEVRPIVGNDGSVEQCQVFFDAVRVPVSDRVGAENQGWEIAKYLLEFERGAYSYYIALTKQLRLLWDLAPEGGEWDAAGPVAAAWALDAAALEIEALSIEYTEHRLRSGAGSGQSPGVLSSLVKLCATELSQRIDTLLLEARGPYALAAQGVALEPRSHALPIGPALGMQVTNAYLNNRAATIYGGSAQVQRNIIARKVLGL